MIALWMIGVALLVLGAACVFLIIAAIAEAAWEWWQSRHGKDDDLPDRVEAVRRRGDGRSAVGRL